MKAPFSPYLLRIKPGLKQLVALLRRDYDYVSVLATDSVGLTVSISRRARSVGSETMSTERGVVVRLYRGGQYREYALNEFDPDRAEETAARIEAELAAQQAVLDGCGTQVYDTAALSDEPLTLFVERETEQLPETTDVKALVDRLTALSDHGMELDERMIECIARAQSTHVCKLFLTEHRDLSQSYVYSEGVVVPVMRGEDGSVQNGYEGVSGLCGPELFTQLDAKLESGVAMVRDLLTAGRIPAQKKTGPKTRPCPKYCLICLIHCAGVNR
jgi:TldD protein